MVHDDLRYRRCAGAVRCSPRQGTCPLEWGAVLNVDVYRIVVDGTSASPKPTSCCHGRSPWTIQCAAERSQQKATVTFRFYRQARTGASAGPRTFPPTGQMESLDNHAAGAGLRVTKRAIGGMSAHFMGLLSRSARLASSCTDLLQGHGAVSRVLDSSSEPSLLTVALVGQLDASTRSRPPRRSVRGTRMPRRGT